MNRRSPVRSVLAERRLFSNGGMLPISTPFQNTPSGILASSPPLIEAVSQEIVAPFTGGAMPMAQGGVAKFQEGGFAAGTLGSQYGFDFNPQGIEIEMVPSITPTRTYTHDKKLWPPGIQSVSPGAHHPRRTGVVATFDPDNPTPMSYGDILSETASEKVLRLFPEWSRTTQTLTVGEEVAPEREKRLEEEGRPFSRAYDAFLHGVTATKQFIAGNVEELSQDAEAFFRTIFGGETRGDIPTENLLAAMSQTRAVMEMIQRAPPEFEDDIKLFAREAVLKNPALTQDGLAEAVAMRLSDKHEGQPNIRVGHHEQEYHEAVTLREPEGAPYPDQAARFQEIITGLTSADQTRDLATDGDWQIGDDYRKGPAWRPDPIADPPQGEEGPPTAEVPIPAAAVPTAAENQQISTENVTENGVEHYPEGGGASVTVDEERTPLVPAAVPPPIEKPATNKTLLEIANAAENRNVDRDMAFFKKRFMDAIGEYEGKTEYEKGLDFLKLGMAIAAGKSPHAIENISRGVLATVDQFGVDEKQKREFKRKVELSAVQYALSGVAKEEALGEADRRKLYFFYDQSKKTDDSPYGELVSVSLEAILANGGKIPDNLREKDLVIREIAAVQNATKLLNDQLTKNAELYRIGRVEEKDLRKRLKDDETAFISATVGNKLINSVIGKLAAEDITGIGNAGKELWRRALVAVGRNPGHKYTNIETARAEIRRAFQLLIPLTLGEAQTANSISNRDVKFLADAFVDEAFLQDGALSFVTISPEVLGLRLKGAMAQFNKAKLSALADYDDVINILRVSEENLRTIETTMGTPLERGRFGRKGLQSTLERVGPLAEQARKSGQPTTAKPLEQVLGWTYAEDPANPGTYRMKGGAGTNFSGKFFDPSQLPELKLLPSE